MKRHRGQSTVRSSRKTESTKPANESGWRDRVIIATWVVAPLLSILLLVLGGLWLQWRNSLEQRLAAWKTAYGLSDDEVSQFRRIELEFHGSGNVFTTPIARSSSETIFHHQQMALLLDTPQRQKFINDLNTGRWNH